MVMGLAVLNAQVFVYTEMAMPIADGALCIAVLRGHGHVRGAVAGSARVHDGRRRSAISPGVLPRPRSCRHWRCSGTSSRAYLHRRVVRDLRDEVGADADHRIQTVPRSVEPGVRRPRRLRRHAGLRRPGADRPPRPSLSSRPAWAPSRSTRETPTSRRWTRCRSVQRRRRQSPSAPALGRSSARWVRHCS